MMCAWTGASSESRHDGLTKIARKPEGVGIELKALASGEMGIIVGLDIMEGKERQKMKKYNREYGEGTAVCLRLMEPLGHVLHGDSYFSSVKTLVALAQRGVRFMGIVKTAHREFPLKYLQSWAAGNEGGPPARGDHVLLESESEEADKFYAVGWADKKPKFLITNVGTTNAVDPIIKSGYKLCYERGEISAMPWIKEVNRPDVVKLFFQYFSTIARLGARMVHSCLVA